MIKKTFFFPTLLSGIVLAFGLGCFGTKFIQPQYMSSSWPADMEIAILPVADIRQNKDTEFKHTAYLKKGISAHLKQRGYKYTSTSAAADAFSNTDMDKLKEPDHDWLKQLGTAGQRFVFVPALTEFQSKMRLGWQTEVQINGYLYDKETGTLLWRHTGSGADSGPMIKGLNQKLALDITMLDLMLGMPKNP